ncbi:MAG: 5'-nucleotidase C-terminal domain-containing protein [Lachnospiraceae bacterium]|nr:5'-nucleotidase C-terminal domain-containing protein [Lachnospiraceae bacterium]
MNCKAFWKWNLILWITLLTILITGCMGVDVFAQASPASIGADGANAQTCAVLPAGANYALANNISGINVQACAMLQAGAIASSNSRTNLSGAVLSTKYTEYEYTGNYRQPNLTVKLGSKVLAKDVDYTVKYSNNKNVGTATITATGIGKYTGTKSVSFKLVKADLAKAALSTKYKEYEYTGNYRQPNLIVKIGSKALKKDVDFKVSYANNKNVGTGTITATGIGNYKGTNSVSFKLIKADLAKANLSTKYREYEYTGNYRQPNLIIKIGSKALKKDVDFKVSYASNKDVGTGTITATGIGNYRGTKSVAFVIVKADLANAALSTKYAEYEYTGKSRQPNPIVKIGSRGLQKDVDFTVSYSANKFVGTGTITATGIGNYTGSVSATFEIVLPEGGADPTRILVIETTDIHGWLLDASSGDPDTFRYNLAYISNAINEARQSGEYDDVVLLDGGDIYQGPPVSNLTYGAAMRAALDAMNYDAVALGNHEFDWDVTQYCADDKGTVAPYELGDYSGDPDIPVLASDLYDAATGERVPFTKDYVMLEKAGMRIAVVGYIPDFSVDVRTEKIAPYVIDDDPEHLNSLLGEVNEQEKPDATLVLAHADPTYVAERIDGSKAALVLGGHTHEVVVQIASNGIPCIQGNRFALGYASAVLVIKPDGSVSVEDIAYTDITENSDSLLDTEENRPHLDETVLDISYLAWNNVWESMSEVLGYVDTSIKKKIKNGIGIAGNWVTGLMVRATEDAGTQIAFYNNGGIRTSLEIPEGANIRQITINDIYTMLPFGNRLMLYDLTGPELARQLSNALKQSNYGDQVSGLSYTYSVSGNPEASGEDLDYEILSITLDDGTEVDLEDNETTYRVCVSNYNATIPGSVFEQKTPVIPEAESPVDAEALIAAIRAISEENDGYLPVDTRARGVEIAVQ